MVFMDNETYDQVEIPMDRLKWERNFIVPNSNVNISSYEGEILGVILPDKANVPGPTLTILPSGKNCTSDKLPDSSTSFNGKLVSLPKPATLSAFLGVVSEAIWNTVSGNKNPLESLN